MTRPVNAAGLALLRQWEQGPGGGPALAAYRDEGGVWTIGYGHTGGVQPGDTCTPGEAGQRLEEDLLPAAAEVERRVRVPLGDNQFAALACFAFNVGRAAFAASTLLIELNAGHYEVVPDRLSRWNHVGGVVSLGLTRRRAAEAALWRRDPYPAPSNPSPGSAAAI